MSCPLCTGGASEVLVCVPCGNFDGRTLYDPIHVLCCDNCGHVYNALSTEDREGLALHYQSTYPIFDLQTPDIAGDRPGGFSSASLKRYAELHAAFSDYVEKDCKILDIGCARGGFLSFLSGQGYTHLQGIDCSTPYIEEARKVCDKAIISLGAADTTGIESGSLDLVNVDQVIEHLPNPAAAFMEARRVLNKAGLFCVSVPDAAEYVNHYNSDFYWLAMREHVQHFDRHHLVALAGRCGFMLVKEATGTPTFFPNLTMVFEKVAMDYPYLHPRWTALDLGFRMGFYIHRCQEGLATSSAVIKALNSQALYVWGIGQEFFLLWNGADLKNQNIIGLIDDTQDKQHLTVSGYPIQPMSVMLENLDADVLITVTSSAVAMKQRLQARGFKGRIFTVSGVAI